MKKLSRFILSAAQTAICGFLLSACTFGEDIYIEEAKHHVGHEISSDAVITGSVKGTMTSGKSYTISGCITVEEGDTLLIEEGTRIEVEPASYIVVRGTFISAGTKENPVWFTASGIKKQDRTDIDINEDPAYRGYWGGIWCDVTCPLAVIKYTHMEYLGMTFDTDPVAGSGRTQRALYFSNPDGYLVFEDNWVYGLSSNGLIIQGGKLNIMRNTFEKGGYTGGDMIAISGNSIGNVAYNLFMGPATTGVKPSNASGGNIRQCEVYAYNNTFVNGGWRCTLPARGGSILYRQDARGKVFNNLLVNCRYGVRMDAKRPDLENIELGYNYSYGENSDVTSEFYPTGHLTQPQDTDIPYPWTILPEGYKAGDIYDGTSWNGQNDPKFVNYPLGNTSGNWLTMAYVGDFDFRLTSNSPARNKGYVNFKPYDDNGSFPVHPLFGSTEITAPSRDMGAFPYDNTGNQHFK